MDFYYTEINHEVLFEKHHCTQGSRTITFLDELASMSIAINPGMQISFKTLLA